MTKPASLPLFAAAVDCSPSGENSKRRRVASSRADGRRVCAPSAEYVVEFDVHGVRRMVHVFAKSPVTAKSAALRRIKNNSPSSALVALFVSAELESARNARYMAQFTA